MTDEQRQLVAEHIASLRSWPGRYEAELAAALETLVADAAWEEIVRQREGKLG